MNVFNAETEEVVEFSLIDVATNTEWTEDAIEGSSVAYNKDAERFEANNSECVWWVDYCAKRQTADQAVYDLLRERDDTDLDEEYHNVKCGVEFNELPEAIEEFIEDHK